MTHVFESSARPPGRTLGPVFRQLLRNCVAELGVPPAVMRSEDAVGTCLERAIRAIPPGLGAPALKSVLSEFAAELPDSIASALRQEGTLGGRGRP